MSTKKLLLVLFVALFFVATKCQDTTDTEGDLVVGNIDDIVEPENTPAENAPAAEEPEKATEEKTLPEAAPTESTTDDTEAAKPEEEEKVVKDAAKPEEEEKVVKDAAKTEEKTVEKTADKKEEYQKVAVLETKPAPVPRQRPLTDLDILRNKLNNVNQLYRQKEDVDEFRTELSQQRAINDVLKQISYAKAPLKDFSFPKHIALHPRHAQLYNQRTKFGVPLARRPNPSLYFNRPGKPTKIANYFEADHNRELFPKEYYPGSPRIRKASRTLDQLERYLSTIPNYRLINNLSREKYYSGVADLPRRY